MEQDHGIDRPLTCPKSGQLLGALVALFRLDDPAVGGPDAARRLDRSARPAKEYFAGEWVGDERRQEVCGWVADALLHSGLIGSITLPSENPGEKPPAAPMLGATIYAWLHRWDSVFHVVASRWPHADQVVGGFVLGRQVVIDLALRWAAATFLTGERPPATDNPDWCAQSGGARILKRLIDEHAPGKTLDTYAKMFDIDPRTLDRWLNQEAPLVPSEANLSSIAMSLAGPDGERVRALRVRLRREYGLFAAARELASGIGWAWATELARGLLRLTRLTLEVHGEEPPNQDFLKNQALSFMNGIAFPINALVLDDWLRMECGRLWRDDILAARDQRLDDRLTGCFRVIATWHSEPPPDLLTKLAPTPAARRRLRETAAIWTMNDSSPTPEEMLRHAEQGHVMYRIKAPDDATRISNRLQQAMVCMQHKDFEGSLVHWARIVALDPGSARHRFFYGAALWQAGPSRDHEKSVEQLQESCRLDPEWDRPFVEIAIVWLNRGLFDHALHHLQSQGERFRSRSDHFNWQEGVALRLLGRLDEALAAFERATQLNPQHGAAFDLAADCAFRLADTIKGRRYAKQGLDLGHDTSFRKWGV